MPPAPRVADANLDRPTSAAPGGTAQPTAGSSLPGRWPATGGVAGLADQCAGRCRPTASLVWSSPGVESSYCWIRSSAAARFASPRLAPDVGGRLGRLDGGWQDTQATRASTWHSAQATCYSIRAGYGPHLRPTSERVLDLG